MSDTLPDRLRKRAGAFGTTGHDDRALMLEAAARIETLEQIASKLPKDRNGVPIVPGVTVDSAHGFRIIVRGIRPINDDATAVMIYGDGGSYLKSLLSDLTVSASEPR